MANQIIKETAKKEGVKLWQIADRLQLTDGNFSRRLRYEFEAAERERVLAIIRDIAAEVKA